MDPDADLEVVRRVVELEVEFGALGRSGHVERGMHHPPRPARHVDAEAALAGFENALDGGPPPARDHGLVGAEEKEARPPVRHDRFSLHPSDVRVQAPIGRPQPPAFHGGCGIDADAMDRRREMETGGAEGPFPAPDPKHREPIEGREFAGQSRQFFPHPQPDGIFTVGQIRHEREAGPIGTCSDRTDRPAKRRRTRGENPASSAVTHRDSDLGVGDGAGQREGDVELDEAAAGTGFVPDDPRGMQREFLAGTCDRLRGMERLPSARHDARGAPAAPRLGVPCLHDVVELEVQGVEIGKPRPQGITQIVHGRPLPRDVHPIEARRGRHTEQSGEVGEEFGHGLVQPPDVVSIHGRNRGIDQVSPMIGANSFDRREVPHVQVPREPVAAVGPVRFEKPFHIVPPLADVGVGVVGDDVMEPAHHPVDRLPQERDVLVPRVEPATVERHVGREHRIDAAKPGDERPVVDGEHVGRGAAVAERVPQPAVHGHPGRLLQMVEDDAAGEGPRTPHGCAGFVGPVVIGGFGDHRTLEFSGGGGGGDSAWSGARSIPVRQLLSRRFSRSPPRGTTLPSSLDRGVPGP